MNTFFIIIFIFHIVNMCLGLSYVCQLFCPLLLLEILFFLLGSIFFWGKSLNNCFSENMQVVMPLCLLVCLKLSLLYLHLWLIVQFLILGWQLFFLGNKKILFSCTLASTVAMTNLASSFFLYLFYLKHFFVGPKDTCFSSFVKFSPIFILLFDSSSFFFFILLNSVDIY